MKFWRRPVSSLTRAEIDSAVDDPQWQMFRMGLKGLTTERKLDELGAYLEAYEGDPAARVRVDNYINALLRGGQLRRICNEMLVVAK